MVAVLSVVVVAGAIFLFRSLSEPSAADVDAMLAGSMCKAKAECPRMIDHITRMDSITSSRPRDYSYYYTIVGLPRDSINAGEFGRVMTRSLRDMARNSSNSRVFEKYKITIHHFYRYDDGQMLFEYTITPDMYK